LTATRIRFGGVRYDFTVSAATYLPACLKFAERIADESGLPRFQVLGPIAPVRVDAARRQRHVLEHNVRGVRSKQELESR
jgi:hypothetical protein